MDITITPRPLKGDITVIPSKSQAHRLLICAAFANNESTLICPEINRDIEATVDCLNTLGYATAGLDGIFGGATERAVYNFQGDYGLARDGVCGCNTWTQITTLVHGNGASSTTIN